MCQPCVSKDSLKHPKMLTLVHPSRLMKSFLASLHWCFALVFDHFVPNLTFLTSIFFESIASHHGRILGTKSIKTHKFQAGVLHLPLISAARSSTLRKKSDSHWKGRPLACSEGLMIKSIPPLLHRKIAQIQTTKWPAQNEIERLRSVPKKPSLVVVQPNRQPNPTVVEVKIQLRNPKMPKMVDSPASIM